MISNNKAQGPPKPLRVAYACSATAAATMARSRFDQAFAARTILLLLRVVVRDDGCEVAEQVGDLWRVLADDMYEARALHFARNRRRCHEAALAVDGSVRVSFFELYLPNR